MLKQSNPEVARELLTLAREDVQARWRMYEHLAALPMGRPEEAKR